MGQTLALVADVHGNLEALEAVLEDIDRRAPNARIACAGDVVGYGPDPGACLTLLRAKGAAIVVGNHEQMVLGSRDFRSCVHAGIRAALWTREQLTATAHGILEQLPLFVEPLPGVVVCHGNLLDAGVYVATPEKAEEALGQLAALRPGASLLVCGHTHQAMLYARGGGLVSALPNAELRWPSTGPCIVNPGAVGQARDRDPLARYALVNVEERVVSYVALPYDHALTLRKLRSAGLVARVVMPPPTGVARRIERFRAQAARRTKSAAMTRPEVPLPGPTTKRRLVLALHHAMARTGADTAFVRARQPDGAMILVYHGIVRDDEAGWIDPRYSIPERAFEAQMRFLARRRRVWSIGQLLETVARGEPIAAGTVVVTFDDGYKSVLDVGAPILERYDIPALLYLATGYVSRQESQFADVLYGAFKQRTRNVLALSDGTLGPVRLSDPSMIQRTYTALEARLLVSSAAQRTELLAEIVERLRPLQPPPRLTLTWDEVARLHRVWPRVELGAHTRDHVDLSACTFETARREVEASVDDVKRALGSAPAHFAYPFGRSGLAARAAVAGAALRSAAVTEPAALVRKGADPLALPRLSAPRDMSLFSFLTSGAYPGLPLALIGRA